VRGWTPIPSQREWGIRSLFVNTYGLLPSGYWPGSTLHHHSRTANAIITARTTMAMTSPFTELRGILLPPFSLQHCLTSSNER
jgi:hypothetical protein